MGIGFSSSNNTTIGPYSLKSKIYESESSIVYSALKSKSNQKYAIKLIKNNIRTLDSIQNEIEINAEIKFHVLIMQVEDIILEVPQEFFCAFVMPLAEGGNLSKFLKKNGLIKEFIVKKVIYDVLGALKYLHSNGIIYRGINPNNILFMDKNIDNAIFILSDFSNSIHFTQGEKINDFTFDKTEYCAPEVLEKKEYDEKIDIWSVGILAYTCLYGTNPFYQKITNFNSIFNEQKIKISSAAQSFISSILKYEPSERISVEQALKHEWFDFDFSIKFLYTLFTYTKQTIPVTNEYLLNKRNKTDEINYKNSLVAQEAKLQPVNSVPTPNKIYQKICKIGQSDFYNEYKIKDLMTGDILSAKCFYRNVDDYPIQKRYEVRQVFQSNLNIYHPSIVKNIYFKENGFDNYHVTTLLTEYLKLKSFKRVINMNAIEKLKAVYGIASAMSYLHKHEILHRSLSLSSVLFDENKEPKIVNVGMSGVISSIYELGKIERIPYFYSPEYYKNNEYTKSSEVYSYGLVIWKIYANVKTNERTSLIKHLQSIYDGKRPSFIATMPDSCCQLIKRCLDENPSKRPTFDEICKELRENPEIITDDVDINEYKRYVDVIESSQNGPNSNGTLKTTQNNKLDNDQQNQRENSNNNSNSNDNNSNNNDNNSNNNDNNSNSNDNNSNNNDNNSNNNDNNSNSNDNDSNNNDNNSNNNDNNSNSNDNDSNNNDNNSNNNDNNSNSNDNDSNSNDNDSNNNDNNSNSNDNNSNSNDNDSNSNDNNSNSNDNDSNNNDNNSNSNDNNSNNNDNNSNNNDNNSNNNDNNSNNNDNNSNNNDNNFNNNDNNSNNNDNNSNNDDKDDESQGEEEDYEEEEEEDFDDDDDVGNEEEDGPNKKKILEILAHNNVNEIDINQFILVKKLGEGSYGFVYKVFKKGRNMKKDGTLAAKIFKFNVFELNIHSPAVINFLRELIFLSKLSHPLIVQFIGYSPNNFKRKQNRKRQVMITEFAQKGSLKDIISKIYNREKIIGFDDTSKLIIIYGIAVSMSHLHSHNIIHRDLKPDNVLIDNFFYPKLADFGLCIKLSREDYHENKYCGTSRYMAPEIWNKCTYSKASDVYAFGILVYELMCGKFAFENCNGAQISYQICINKSYPEIPAAVPTAYRNLIESCWLEEKSERPTFDEIIENLKTNSQFITGKIDARKYRNYIETIERQVQTIELNEITIEISTI